MDESTYRVEALRPIDGFTNEEVVHDGITTHAAARDVAEALAGPPAWWDLVTVVQIQPDGHETTVDTYFEGGVA